MLQYMKMMLGFQDCAVSDRILEMIIKNYRIIQKKGGNANIEDAVKVLFAVNKKYSKPTAKSSNYRCSGFVTYNLSNNIESEGIKCA